ncbi:MAG TPA: MBL fold metallo-hydrolase, partial [Chloroflexia bacterium]|nr:MBL fold metallo-hydrolase [Chloroflexia bacterium]
MADAETWASPYFRLQRVADGIYAAIIVPGTGAWGNAGIVDLGERTLVFDTFATPAAARDLQAAAEHVTGRPVTWVVNSHNHLDHTFGNEVFTQATIVATGRTHDLILARGAAFIEAARRDLSGLDTLEAQRDAESDPAKQRDLSNTLGEYRAIVAGLDTLQLRLPDLTFDKSLVFHGTHRTAELITYGGGHTPSDAFLYLPNERLLYMGDLVPVGFHPMMQQGDPEEWDRILARVGELNIETIVPGHGPVGTVWDLVRTRQYLTDLQS